MAEARPKTLRELADLMRSSAVGAETVLFRGGGSKQSWLREGLGSGLEIQLDALCGVVEHAHGDMTATVAAGTRFRELQESLAEKGQWLAVDPPLGDSEEATLGGIFSSDDSGPGRLAFGSLRELAIGGTFVLSDGTVARSGGKVIKNVAGYDLCKIFCGARGTLGAVAELTVRLHPIAPREVSLRVPGRGPELAKAALTLSTGRLSPSAVSVQGESLDVRFQGTTAFVDAQAKIAGATMSEFGGSVQRIEDEESRAHWRSAVELRRGLPGDTITVASLLPTEVPGFLSVAQRSVDELQAIADPRLGHVVLCLAVPGLEALAALIGSLRAEAVSRGGTLRVRKRPMGLDRLVDPFGELPSGLGIMSALKTHLDPVGRCMPGRYLLPV